MSLFITMAAALALSAMAAVIMARGNKTLTTYAVAQRQLTSAVERRSELAVVRYEIHTSGATPADGKPIELSVLGQSRLTSVQDVYGLVDINAASPALLARLLASAAPGITTEQIDRLRQSQRFEHVGELFTQLAIAGLPARTIAPFLTTESGRRRISTQTAPIGLLEVLSGVVGSRSDMVAALPTQFFETRSPVVFEVRFLGAGPAR